MTVKVTMANGSSDSVDFVNNAGTTLAQVKGIDGGSSNGSLALHTTASGTSTERVRVDNAGNVGVGTSSPGARLHTQVSSGNTIAKFENTISTPGYLGEIILAAPNRPAVRFNFQTSNDSNGFFNYDTGVFKVFNNVGGSATQSLEIDTSANLKFNSGYGSVATAYGCRAWVNFNGTGTVAIRASGNVSSITDNGTGDYTLNFAITFPDTNYCPLTGWGGDGNGDAFNLSIKGSGNSTSAPATMSTTQVRMLFGSSGSQKQDPYTACVGVMR